MYTCVTCLREFTRSFNLQRHIEREHPSDLEDRMSSGMSDIISEMEDEMPGAMSDRNNISCNDCGAVFATNTFLRRHMFKCPQDTENEESSDYEDDCGWEAMLEDCKIKFDDDIN